MRALGETPVGAKHLGLTMYLTEAWSRGWRGSGRCSDEGSQILCCAARSRVAAPHALGERHGRDQKANPKLMPGRPNNHRVYSNHRADNRADSRSLRHRAYVPSATPIATPFRSKLHKPASVSRASFLPDSKPANSRCWAFKNQLICVQDPPRVSAGLTLVFHSQYRVAIPFRPKNHTQQG
jgi:hypothetical protein